MITLSTIFTLAGFEFFYQTSHKATFIRPAELEAWFKTNGKLAKILGSVLLVIGLVLSVITLGLGSGSIAFTCILMMIASLVVIISPLGWVKTGWLLTGFGVLFILELL